MILQQWDEDALLKEALHEPIRDRNIEILDQGQSGAFVARITGSTRDNQNFSVVVKKRNGESSHSSLWYVDDPGWSEREYHIYALLEDLSLPHCRVLAKRFRNPGDWTLILEDLAQDYRMLTPEYQFTLADKTTIVNTYAAIHSRTMGLTGSIVDYLQPEEGSQVNESTASEMLETLMDYAVGQERLHADDFMGAVRTLLHLREKWKDEPRCLTYNDFYQTNVALPKTEDGFAVLFDWELARIGLPHFDAINAGFMDEYLLNHYFECMSESGVQIDPQRYQAGFQYAGMCMDFSLLWLMHLKLKADPTGRLPSWMKTSAERLFLVDLRRYASIDA